jgi:Fe-S-cluster containining protein
MRERAFLDRYTRLAPNRAELVLAERPDGACIFLRGNLCRVYTSRPRQCREFPVAWRVDGPCRDGARERIALGGPGSEPT